MSMKELFVSPADGGIAAALDSISGTDAYTITLAAGTYAEILSYNKPNPLRIQAAPSVKAEDCRIAAENCEAFHKDTENRAVLVFGMDCTRVELAGFTIENTHVKTLPSEALGNQAEALCWHNRTGFLHAQNMRFISRQDTIHVKGYSRFSDCYISGDVDYIWGYCHTCLLEHCTVHTRADNRGDFDAYVLQSRALRGAPGFIFRHCEFTAEKREIAQIYIGRSAGTGTASSADRWDSIALIDCIVSHDYNPALYTDEGKCIVFPKGCADYGWREYGTRVRRADRSLVPADTSARYPANYVMTEEESARLCAKTDIK